MIERAFATLLPDPSCHNYPLRMPDDLADATYKYALRLDADALHQFPFAHLRVFSILDRNLLECWRGSCTKRYPTCSVLTSATALRVQQRLEAELRLAISDFERLFARVDRDGNTIRAVNILLTVRWLQARFWLLSKQHGLIAVGAGAELEIGFLPRVLMDELAVLQRLAAHELDSGMDWACKLFDVSFCRFETCAPADLLLLYYAAGSHKRQGDQRA